MSPDPSHMSWDRMLEDLRRQPLALPIGNHELKHDQVNPRNAYKGKTAPEELPEAVRDER